MRRSEAALRDIEVVGELMPDNGTLVSVSHFWQDIFEPFPGSAPLPFAAA